VLLVDIYDYRARKERKFSDFILAERRNGKSEKFSVRTSVGYIDAYIYRPENHPQTDLPIFINLHGGGFVLGYCEQDGKYCQLLANMADSAVVNIDYCLAPENKFPAAIESTYEVIKHLKYNGNRYGLNSRKMIVGGHSAGGNISAALVLMSQKEKENLFMGLILDYAPLNFADPKKLSSTDRMRDYMDWYFKDEKDKFNEFASPLLAKDVSKFPSTLIISASYDPLCPEEEEFSNKLKQSNVPVEYYCFDGCMHGFTHDIFAEYNKEMSNKAWNIMGEFLIKRFYEQE
jgi:acetyl esterase